MTSLMTMSDDFGVPMWVTQSARELAEQFASQQPTRQKAQQVYQNTLAVSVVNGYLKLLGVATDVTASDSWNPALRFANNVADLYVVGKGHIECRSVASGEDVCFVPMEVHSDRIAFIVVQFDNDEAATLLGFTDKVSSVNLSLSQLTPMTELPQHLAEADAVTALRQWLDGLYQLNWQSPEALLQPSQLALSHRQATVQRAKLITLNLASEHSDVVLLLSVSSSSDSSVSNSSEFDSPASVAADTVLTVGAQLYPAIVMPQPTAGVRFTSPLSESLVPEIKLSLYSQAGMLSKEAISRTYPRDNCIQIPQFQGQPGENFVLKISAGNRQIAEHFQL